MQSDPLAEATVLVSDLENIHSTLTLVKDVLIADDLARSGRLLVAATYTPLTQDVMARHERVEGILKEHYANQYLAGQDLDEEEPDEHEQQAAQAAVEQSLKANPLGTGQARRPAPKLELTDDEPGMIEEE